MAELSTAETRAIIGRWPSIIWRMHLRCWIRLRRRTDERRIWRRTSLGVGRTPVLGVVMSVVAIYKQSRLVPQSVLAPAQSRGG